MSAAWHVSGIRGKKRKPITAEPTLESARAHIDGARRKYDRDPRELGPTTAGKLLADLEWACEQVEEAQAKLEWRGGWTRVTGEKSGWQLRAEAAEAKAEEQARRIEELEDFLATAAEDDADPEQGIRELARLRRVEKMSRDFIEYWIACRIREGEGPYFEDLAPLDAAAAALRVVLGETETTQP